MKGLVPLIASNVGSVLKLAVINIGLDPRDYTFHSFRRSGASHAVNENVTLEIKNNIVTG